MNRLALLLSFLVAGELLADRPNVLLIMADDFGYECVSVNGGGYRTPHLDRLAAGGARFERCYAQPLCTPTRVQLMTGQYNQRNYVRFGYLDPTQQTFAQWFRTAGYATGVYGKWQLGGGYKGPGHFGFDDYCLWQLNRRPPRYANPGLEINGKQVDYKAGEYGPDLVSDHLCAFFEKNRDKPFFAYYPMMLTHGPFEPTPDSPAYRKDALGPEGSGKRIANKKHFADMVVYADKIIGKIVAKLDALGLREKTIIVFTGDNGTGRPITSQLNGKPYPGGKGRTTAAGMHVPLIVNWPGKIAPRQVVRDLVDFTDLAPTLLDATRVPRPKDWPLDGHSLWPRLSGAKAEPRNWIYSWYARDGGRSGTTFARGEHLKLYGDGALYDVERDPEEKTPLRSADLSEQQRTERDMLASVLKKYAETRPRWTWADRAESTRGWRYVRPVKDRFVLESDIKEVTTKEGATYTSLTDRGSEKMTLTIRFDEKQRVRDAEAVQETAKGKQMVSVVFKETEAIVTRKGTTQRLKVTPDVVVTTAPDWSDIFQVIRRYNSKKGGKQSFAGLWIHPVQEIRQLSFTVEPGKDVEIEVEGKKMTLKRYRVVLRSGGYDVWADDKGLVIRLTTAGKPGAAVILEGYEKATSGLR
jgi:arylsulfatase A